ncbi:MAG: family 20 glycosylhydrolase [Planctomycetota bacterium]|nr:family 20 glycosylhydrolase [Planctomycetota bacterium]
MKTIMTWLVSTCVVGLLTACCAAQTSGLTLIPWPKTVKEGGGELAVKPSAKIVATSKELLPLGRVLTEELFRLTGLRLAVEEGKGGDGDIVLAIDRSLAAEGRYFSHAVDVDKTVAVRGEDYAATAQGTATLLQLIAYGEKGVRFPRVAITDYSPASYPGAMLDVARRRNTLEVLRDCINLCRLYKVRYFHLHLNDMESFTFPSKLFPKLGTNRRGAFGGPAPEVYPREQLEELLRYADDRGVAIVPELETVFHTGSMMADMPDVFGGPGILDQTNEKMYEALDALIGEMCDVFKSSPYFHIGCDEAGYGQLVNQPTAKDYMAKHGLKNADDIYRFHIQRLNKVIKAHGKRTIVWQDCPLPPDKDVIVMAWRIDLDHGPTPALIKEGRPVIQVTWTPCIFWNVKDNFAWHVYDDDVKPGPLAIGSQMIFWEGEGPSAMPWLRYRVPPRQERTYSPDATRSYEDFARSLAVLDSRLDVLTAGIELQEKGASGSTYEWLTRNAGYILPISTFSGPLEITLVSRVPGATVRYTLDDKPPTNASPAASGPVRIEKPEGEKLMLRAALFDAAGKPIGNGLWREYHWEPFTVNVSGSMGAGDWRFNKTATIAVSGNQSGGTVRYQVGGAVTKDSPACDKPIVLTDSGEVQIRCFAADGKPLGATWKQGFGKIDYDPDNLTFGKPVTTELEISAKTRALATDGIVNRDQHVGFSPGPKWLTVDLEKETLLGKVALYTFWGDGRSYKYTIELSSDGKEWTKVGDGSQNTVAATEKGYAHEFPARKARYIKVTMIANTANVGLHVAEVRAWAPK